MVLTGALIDVSVSVTALPERGGDVLASATRTAAAGGFNVVAAIARQGVRCVYCGPHGTGSNGDVLRAALAAEGVAAVTPRRGDGDTGFCVVLVEPDGERTLVTCPGVESARSGSDLAATRPVGDDIVAVSGYDLIPAVGGPQLSTMLSSLPASVTLALDVGPLVLDIPRDRLDATVARAAVLTSNQREARMLAGASGLSGPDLVGAVRRLPAVSPMTTVVVREGAAGCTASGGLLGERVLAVPAPRVRALDTTGAGDTHLGVLLAELAVGAGIGSALETANRAAAISVTRAGSAAAPTRAEIHRAAGWNHRLPDAGAYARLARNEDSAATDSSTV